MFVDGNAQVADPVKWTFFHEVSGEMEVELIFKASEHNFRADAFHEKCDNKLDTLTLIRTEFGKTIGGYTHSSWKSDSICTFVKDKSKRACLFSLDMM